MAVESAAPRVGARRIADIPPELRRALDEGRAETRTLVEWLAIDAATLLEHALPAAGFTAAETGAAVQAAVARRGEGIVARVRGAGIVARVRGAGASVHALLVAGPRRARRFAALSSHRSDMVRAFAALSVAADAQLALADRLAALRPFAADPAMSVRECAWDALRPWLAVDLRRGLRALQPWVADGDAGVRRCAIEATRPRGVWTTHLEALKRDPQPAAPLLEAVRADPSDYVRRSVGNWLNDASKSRPDWVRALCARWSAGAPPPETAWIVRHALRTLRKARPR